MIRCSLELTVMVSLAACKGVADRGPEQRTVDQTIVDDEPVEEQFATATCDGVDVTVRWWGPRIQAEFGPLQLFTRLDLRTAKGEVIPWIQSTEEGGTNQKPVVVFAPDCEHVAISQFFAPYVVVASRDLVAFAKGEAVTAHYLENQEPCAMTFGYGEFKWLTATTVEYVLFRGNSRTIRTRDFREAPLSLPDMRCDDPNSPLYEPPESETNGQ